MGLWPFCVHWKHNVCASRIFVLPNYIEAGLVFWITKSDITLWILNRFCSYFHTCHMWTRIKNTRSGYKKYFVLRSPGAGGHSPARGVVRRRATRASRVRAGARRSAAARRRCAAGGGRWAAPRRRRRAERRRRPSWPPAAADWRRTARAGSRRRLAASAASMHPQTTWAHPIDILMSMAHPHQEVMDFLKPAWVKTQIRRCRMNGYVDPSQACYLYNTQLVLRRPGMWRSSRSTEKPANTSVTSLAANHGHFNVQNPNNNSFYRLFGMIFKIYGNNFFRPFHVFVHKVFVLNCCKTISHHCLTRPCAKMNNTIMITAAYLSTCCDKPQRTFDACAGLNTPPAAMAPSQPDSMWLCRIRSATLIWGATGSSGTVMPS